MSNCKIKKKTDQIVVFETKSNKSFIQNNIDKLYAL